MNEYKSAEFPSSFRVFYRRAFKLVCKAAANLHHQIEIKEGAIAKDSQSLLKYMQQFVEFIIGKCCTPMFGEDEVFWERVKELYKECVDDFVLIQAWIEIIKAKTNSLADALVEITKEDLGILMNLDVNPFKPLSMANEYVLQVLFDAFNNPADKYDKVRSTKIYKDSFKLWIKLLRLIEMPEDFTINRILIEYSRSNFLYIL